MGSHGLGVPTHWGHADPIREPPKCPAWGSGGARPRRVLQRVMVPCSECAATGLASSLPPAALLMGEAKSCPPLLAGAWLLWETCGFPLAMG